MAAEWIAQGLSNSGLVQVVDARSMAEIMRDMPASGLSDNDTSAEGARGIATRLGAGLVVTGSLFKSGDSLVVQVRIVNPHTGKLRTPIPPMGVSLANATAALELLRERVTGAVAVILDTRLAHTDATGSVPPTFESYTEYLKGIQAFGRDNSSALQHFLNAASIDTAFRQARLWSAMAMANTRRYAQAESAFKLVDREKLAPTIRPTTTTSAPVSWTAIGKRPTRVPIACSNWRRMRDTRTSLLVSLQFLRCECRKGST